MTNKSHRVWRTYLAGLELLYPVGKGYELNLLKFGWACHIPLSPQALPVIMF